MSEHADTLKERIAMYPDDACWAAFCRLKLLGNDEMPKKHSSDYYWYEMGWDAAEQFHET